jgi:hypothetical protein
VAVSPISPTTHPHPPPLGALLDQVEYRYPLPIDDGPRRSRSLLGEPPGAAIEVGIDSHPVLAQWPRLVLRRSGSGRPNERLWLNTSTRPGESIDSHTVLSDDAAFPVCSDTGPSTALPPLRHAPALTPTRPPHRPISDPYGQPRGHCRGRHGDGPPPTPPPTKPAPSPTPSFTSPPHRGVNGCHRRPGPCRPAGRGLRSESPGGPGSATGDRHGPCAAPRPVARGGGGGEEDERT